MVKPVLSIIIVSFNTKQITLNCLDSIFGSKISVPFEVIIFDNASTDGSPKTLQEFAKNHSEVKLIENHQNIGFGRGNNEAVKHAQGEYLLLLNSDTVTLDDAIDKLFNYFKEHEDKIHFLGGKLFNKDMSPQPSCGYFFTLPILFAFLFLKGDHWGLTRKSPDRAKKVDWLSGSCILTKKAYFDRLGGFDEKIFMYMEEVDLLFRASKESFSTYFYPQARFIHLGSASSKRSFPILQAYRGFIYFYKKHYGAAALFILKIMLQLKAGIAVLIGRTTKNHYLTDTYEEAYKVAQMA